MSRTITVKGVGRVSTPPDYIVISMSLEAQDTNYEKAMEQAALQIDYLNKALESVGFKKKSVKTVNFNVRTDYERVKDRNGNYKSVFNGYICNHRLKVEFDFDTRRLAQSLSAISKCLAKPELSIAFTVKDPSAVNKKLLKSATIKKRKFFAKPRMWRWEICSPSTIIGANSMLSHALNICLMKSAWRCRWEPWPIWTSNRMTLM